MSDFYRPAETPIARIRHRCIGCFHDIAPGEQYSRQTGVYDGRWFVNKLHRECEDALSKDARAGEWYDFNHGDLEPPERLREVAK